MRGEIFVGIDDLALAGLSRVFSFSIIHA
jgi:hypothetical protein